MPLSLTSMRGRPRQLEYHAVQLPSHADARQRCVDDAGEALAAEVVHHRQDAEFACRRPMHPRRNRATSSGCGSRGAAVGHACRAPACCPPRLRTVMESFLAIDAIELFMIEPDAFPGQQDVQKAVAEPSALLGQFPHTACGCRRRPAASIRRLCKSSRSIPTSERRHGAASD